MNQPLPSYAYNASAIGLGGVIRQGKRTTVIPTVASVCLATAGGEASNSFDYYDRDGISFTKAQTRVGGYSVGRGKNRRHSTFAEVLLLNLKIFDRVSIARMQALVTSTRDIEFSDPEQELVPDRSRFSVLLMYHGVEVDGEEVGPEVDTDLCDAKSYENFCNLLEARGDKLLPETVTLLKVHRKLPGPPLNGPLVSFPGHKNAKANRVDVPGFGRAHFGDVIVKPDRQRVSLLRLSLNSLWTPKRVVARPGAVRTASVELAEETAFGGADGGGGSLSCGDSGSNGVPIWP